MTKLKQDKITVTTNRFKLAGWFLLMGIVTLFSPKFAKEVISYWATYKKILNDEKINNLHK